MVRLLDEGCERRFILVQNRNNEVSYLRDECLVGWENIWTSNLEEVELLSLPVASDLLYRFAQEKVSYFRRLCLRELKRKEK